MSTLLTRPEDESAASASSADVYAGRRWRVGTLTYTAGGLTLVFGWLLLGDFAWNMKDKSIFPICQIVLRGFGAKDWLVALVMGSVPAAIGLLLGPVIGVVSDRYRSRWGRRIPFILGAAPLIMLTMLGLAATPDLGASLAHRLAGTRLAIRAGTEANLLGECRIGIFILFWSALDIASIVANSLYGALVNDVVPQVVVGRFFGLFRCVALAAGIIFNYWFLGKADAHSTIMLAGLGLLYGSCFILMCLKVKEGQYPPPPPHLHIKTLGERLAPVVEYLKECYGNPFFLSFFLVTLLGGLALGPVNAFPVYQSRSLHMSDDALGKCIGISYAFSLVLAYPLGMLADRIHPLRLGFLTMALYAAVTAFGFCYAFTARTFFIAFLLHTVVSGSYITGTASIAQRLLPRAKFAEISAAGGIIGSIVGMFFGPALGVFVEWRHHEYRYMFLLGCLLSMMTCVSYVLLYWQYDARGGDRSFVPPE